MHIVVTRVLDGRVLEFNRAPLGMGKHPSCEVHVETPYVSRVQAVIVWRDSTAWIVAAASAARTRVDGEIISCETLTPLANGAKIELGDGMYYRVEYEAGAEGEPASPWAEHPSPDVQKLLKRAEERLPR